MQNLVSKNPILRFKIQCYLGGTPKGGINLGIKSKKEIESNNNKERNLASHHFSKVFSDNEGIWDGIKHLARGILHGYNGYLDPETLYQTGAPTILPGRTPTKVPSVRKVGKMLKNRLFLRGYNKSDIRITQVPYNQVPEGERITMFKNADGSRTPRYYDKKYGHWIDVEYPSSIMSPKVNNVPKITRSTPKVQNLSNDTEVSIIENPYIPEYDYNNDVQIINSALDDAYNYYNPDIIVDLLKKGGLLVSRNPVLRFKLGKKILKAQNGLLFIYYKGRDGKDYEAWRGGNDWYYRQKGTTGMTRMPYDYITTTGLKFYNSTSKGAVANTYDVVNNMSNKLQDVPVTGKIVSNKSPLYNINYAIDNYINGFNAAQQGKNIDSKLAFQRSFRAGYNDYKNPQSKPKLTITKPVNNRWVNGIQKRDEITDVRATQQMLKDAGFDIGKYGVDGKWGKDTEKAYNLYLTMKNIPVYERTPEQTVDISSPSKVLNSTVVNLEPITTDLIIANNNTPTVENEGEKYFARNGNYNKSQVRELMRQKGLNPYSFSGSDRKAIRLWLNGETDDWGRLAFKNSRLYDAFVRPYGYKQGGQLVSRNPINRFKNKKK